MHQGNKLHCSIFSSLSLFLFPWAGQLLIPSKWPDGDVQRFKIFLTPTLVPASATEWTVEEGPFPSSTGTVKNTKKVTSQLYFTYNLSRQLCQGCV